MKRYTRVCAALWDMMTLFRFFHKILKHIYEDEIISTSCQLYDIETVIL